MESSHFKNMLMAHGFLTGLANCGQEQKKLYVLLGDKLGYKFYLSILKYDAFSFQLTSNFLKSDQLY
jgi:hypothetical protein